MAVMALFAGSSAGAGSGEFHIYRGIRRREQNRVKWIETQAANVCTIRVYNITSQFITIITINGAHDIMIYNGKV